MIYFSEILILVNCLFEFAYQEAHPKYHRGKRENAFIHMIRVIQTIQISTISISTESH